MPTLKIIASPIGNLNDITNNFINTINMLDILFCEDTRVTANLLNLLKFENKPKLISCHNFNEKENLDDILVNIKNNKCGLISDAGYPCLSDPGYLLVNECHKNDIRIEVIDGPSAITHAIVQSGFCSNGYIFLGFLPRNKKEMINIIELMKKNKLPLVIFESVHRVQETIKIFKASFPNFDIYVGRELTKKFETYFVGKVSDIPEQILKGEFTLVISPEIVSDEDIEIESLRLDIESLIANNMKIKDASKYLGLKHNIKPTDIYNYFIKNK
ncbi:MAG: 16S rRNA (cytidine(1402)-2'-O)-methyltransferase [Mycoplasma sp.]